RFQRSVGQSLARCQIGNARRQPVEIGEQAVDPLDRSQKRLLAAELHRTGHGGDSFPDPSRRLGRRLPTTSRRLGRTDYFPNVLMIFSRYSRAFARIASSSSVSGLRSSTTVLPWMTTVRTSPAFTAYTKCE